MIRCVDRRNRLAGDFWRGRCRNAGCGHHWPRQRGQYEWCRQHRLAERYFGGIVFNGGSTLLTVTTNNANVRLNGAVTLNSNLKIDTGAGVGDITFTAASTGSGRIDSQTGEHNDLTLNAGTGSIFFNGNIGANQSLGSLIVDTAAGGVTFGGSDIAVTGGSGPLTTIRTEGIIDIGSGTNAADVIGGTGIIFNGGNSQCVTTNNANVRLNGAVTLHSSLKISTGSGTGHVVFTNDTPIDSQAGEFNALTIDAGTGVARFNEDLGKIQTRCSHCRKGVPGHFWRSGQRSRQRIHGARERDQHQWTD